MAAPSAGCTLCELPVEGSDVTDEDGNRFCCQGCREINETIDTIETVDAAAVRKRVGESASDPQAADSDSAQSEETPTASAFLELDGMHCVSCEAFIEALATKHEGVSDAAASYVTETVRIDHDGSVAEETLIEDLSGLGYTAYPRDDEFRKRRADNWAFARLALGGLVGMMVMMLYILVIYPTYFDHGLYYPPAVADFMRELLSETGAMYFYVVLATLTGVVLGFTGKPILQSAYVAVKTRSPNMNLLVALAAVSAYAYSTIDILLASGIPHLYYDVTVTIVLAVTAGSYYEAELKRTATERLSDLTSVQVDEARLVDGDEPQEVSVDELQRGDRVLVRAGERVPVDGEVVDGSGTVDESVITGESLPIDKSVGDDVVGGSVLSGGAVVVAVDEGAGSSLDRITNMVWDLQSGSHGIQSLVDRLATIFVPVVLAIAAVVLAVNLAIGQPVGTALLLGLTVLIVACPCAMGLAAPLSIATGLREALDRGIVVFDETVFERLRGVDTVVFDKTGTLTTGDLTVVDADADDDLLELAARLESRSSHPVAAAITERFGTRPSSVQPDGGEVLPDEQAETDPSETDHDGIETFDDRRKGVTGTVDGTAVTVGHPALFDDLDWTISDELRQTVKERRADGHLPVLVGRAGEAEGLVLLDDELRDGWAETIDSLADRAVEVVVLTGDDQAATAKLRAHEGISQVFAGVPPEAKAETVARLSATGEIAMVGDGTNDAPALARADLGIALGGGTAMAVDAADVAVVDDDLRSIESIFDLAGAANRRIKENIGWAFAYNAIAIPLAVGGLINPLFAAVAMATSSLLVVANASRDLL